MSVRVAFALPLEAEDRLSAEAIRHGHEIVARCSTAHELASRIDAVSPDVAIVAATERHLTQDVLAQQLELRTGLHNVGRAVLAEAEDLPVVRPRGGGETAAQTLPLVDRLPGLCLETGSARLTPSGSPGCWSSASTSQRRSPRSA